MKANPCRPIARPSAWIIVTLLALLTGGSAALAQPDTDELPDEVAQRFDELSDIRFREVSRSIIFEALLFADKPDLTPMGVHRLMMAYHPALNQAHLRDLARQASERGALLCLDIEHLPTDPVFDEPRTVRRSLRRLGWVADVIHDERPGVRLGYYRLMPLRVSHYLSHHDPDRRAEWQEANSRSRHAADPDGLTDPEGLADKVDVLFPSLYAPTPNLEQWTKSSIAAIEEARKYGKQVYPFVWFRHHGKPQYERDMVDPEMFRAMLWTCLMYADGVVVWGGWQEEFDPDAPWFEVLTEVALNHRDIKTARSQLRR